MAQVIDTIETIQVARLEKVATKKDLFLVKEELKADITAVKLELAVLKWVAFSTFGIVVAVAVKQFFG